VRKTRRNLSLHKDAPVPRTIQTVSRERQRRQFWADCTTNISERKFRQGQACSV